MSDPGKQFGLDETINLDGRQTTIRQEHQRGMVKLHVGLVRVTVGSDGPVRRPHDHYRALIEKRDKSTDPFAVSEADYNYLRGLKILVDPAGNKRALLVIGVGPNSASPGAELFFTVRLTDVDGNVPDGIPDPLTEPLPYDEALAAAERLAAERGLRLYEG